MHYNAPGCRECNRLKIQTQDLEQLGYDELAEQVYQLAQMILQHSYEAHRMALDKPDKV